MTVHKHVKRRESLIQIIKNSIKNHTYFLYNGKFYRQELENTVMGTLNFQPIFYILLSLPSQLTKFDNWLHFTVEKEAKVEIEFFFRRQIIKRQNHENLLFKLV